MKIAPLFYFFGFVFAAAGRDQEIGSKYSGKAEVAGLGAVAFPAGDWFLEFRRTSPKPNPSHRPDYFGFRKTGDTVERLGFRRYDPTIAPDQLSHLLDGICEDLGEGAPVEELGTVAPFGTNYPMRFDPPLLNIKPTETEILFSFISVRPDRALNWLCHSCLLMRNGWTTVVFHASPSVLNPDTVQEVGFLSQFTNSAAAPTTK